MSQPNKKKQILLISAQLFSQKGYEKTSLREIAEQAGISKSTLYCYMKNKHDLLYIIMSELMEFGIAGLREIGGMSVSIEEKVRLSIHHHLSAYEIFPSGNAVILYEKTDWLPSNLRRKIKSKFKTYISLWDKLIDEAKTSGVVRPDLDPKILVWSILGMCNWIYKWYSEKGMLSYSEIADNFYLILGEGAFVKGK